jgi:hypothetical protein
MVRTSIPGSLSVVCGRGKGPSNLLGTVVALTAPKKIDAVFGNCQILRGGYTGDGSPISHRVELGRLGGKSN